MIPRWLARQVFYPLQDALRGRRSVALSRSLDASQWYRPERLRALQDRKLAALLVHAEQSPFYRARFQTAGVAAAAPDPRSVLAALPVLDKSEIRHGGTALWTRRRPGVESCTSGSSGSPLTFQVCRRRLASDIAARLRAHRWFGVTPGDPTIYLWGARIERDRQDVLRAFRDRLINERLFNAFDLSDERLQQYAMWIRSARPEAMYSYASTLWRFATFAREASPALYGAVRVAFATGEVMHEHWRAEITAALGCVVAEEYGCREAGLIAHECPEGAYHISAENLIVEILDDENLPVDSDSEGRIVVTNLEAWGMPFIRYDTGDRGCQRAAPCRCGRRLPVMHRPTGRTFEFLHTTAGTRITGVSISRDLKEVPGLAHYRVIQTARERVRVHIVPATGFDMASGVEAIRKRLTARLGEVQVDVEPCAQLPEHASGKYRYVLNEIPAEPAVDNGMVGAVPER